MVGHDEKNGKRTKEDNLVNIGSRPNHKELAAKGGRNGNPSEALKKRFFLKKLKEKTLKQGDVEWILGRCENSELFGLDMITQLAEIEKEPDLSISRRLHIIDLKNRIMPSIHGIRTRNENLNVNVNIDQEEWEKRFME